MRTIFVLAVAMFLFVDTTRAESDEPKVASTAAVYSLDGLRFTPKGDATTQQVLAALTSAGLQAKLTP